MCFSLTDQLEIRFWHDVVLGDIRGPQAGELVAVFININMLTLASAWLVLAAVAQQRHSQWSVEVTPSVVDGNANAGIT